MQRKFDKSRKGELDSQLKTQINNSSVNKIFNMKNDQLIRRELLEHEIRNLKQ